MAGKMNDDKVRCSFAANPSSRLQTDRRSNGAYICDECVEICAEIIDEGGWRRPAPESIRAALRILRINLLTPEEMKAFLDDYVIGQDEAKKGSLGGGVQS